jgi:hypothetical protein
MLTSAPPTWPAIVKETALNSMRIDKQVAAGLQEVGGVGVPLMPSSA